MADQSCTLGKSISIKGDVSGDEDLIVEGRIDGKITLAKHLHVDASGVVVADVEAEQLTISGALRGDIRSSAGVSIQPGARVEGNIHCPRVAIEEGALFSGRIEMDVELPEGVGQ